LLKFKEHKEVNDMHSTSRVTYEKIYENADDVHVRNRIMHRNPEDTVLYKDARFKVGVPYTDIQDLFEKGVLIKDGIAVYKPTEFGYDEVLDPVEEGLPIAIPYIGYYKQTAGTQPGEFETTFVKVYGIDPNIPPTLLFSITFSAAAGAETLEGATISVFADQDRLIPVEDYSEVLPGTYYYTVSKAGFVTEEDSVEIVDQNVEVEVALEPITYKIIFVAATGAETLDGATISVFSDQDRLIPVEDYSEVLPGTYYYTVSKAGFNDVTDSIEVTDKDETVEITLTQE
jgi:hypothetical protein